MTDREIALAHLILYDAKVPANIPALREHWNKHLDTMLNSEHKGDCTREPGACVKCLADEAFQVVPVYRALFNI